MIKQTFIWGSRLNNIIQPTLCLKSSVLHAVTGIKINKTTRVPIFLHSQFFTFYFISYNQILLFKKSLFGKHPSRGERGNLSHGLDVTFVISRHQSALALKCWYKKGPELGSEVTYIDFLGVRLLHFRWEDVLCFSCQIQNILLLSIFLLGFYTMGL